MKVILRNSSLVFQTAKSDADVQFTVVLTSANPTLASSMTDVQIPVGTYTVVCTPDVPFNYPLYFKTKKYDNTGTANSVRIAASDGIWTDTVPIENYIQIPANGFGFANTPSEDITITVKMYKQS